MGKETLPHSIAMFSSKMFTQLVSEKALSGNLAVSPFLTHLSLSALHLGSKGKTKEDFDKVLGNWTEPCQDNGMGCPYRRLLKKLNEKSKAYDLNIASRPYIREEPDPKYQKKLK